jgi:Domain of unknown function (DUF4105)
VAHICLATQRSFLYLAVQTAPSAISETTLSFSNKTLAILAFVFLHLSTDIAFANTDQIIDYSRLKSLSVSEEWKNLLHYNDGKSYIDDEKYFLSNTGHIDPYSELLASIDAIISDQQVYCRFPYRRQWLETKIPELTEKLPTYSCPDFEQWRSQINADSVTLVLASSYLNSPSSMYGHTFFRFDTSNKVGTTDLAAISVNFAAVVNETDGISFAYKGLFGGYPGRFSTAPYFKKIKEYNRIENRDIWEYQLNLSPTETNSMIDHLWELDQITFDYYFFDENCSFRLLELIEIARPGLEITDAFGLSAIPIDTVRVISDADLIKATHFRPSNQKKVENLAAQLDTKLSGMAIQLALGEQKLSDIESIVTDKNERYKVVELAYKYARFLANKDGKTEANSRTSFELLNAINQLSAYQSSAVEAVRPHDPISGHESRSLTISSSYNTSQGHYFNDVEIKASYHNLLDNQIGYPEGASLNIGGIKLRVTDDEKLRLQALDIINIRSLQAASRFFPSSSWGVRLGANRMYYFEADLARARNESLASFLTGEYGTTIKLSPLINAFVLGNASIEHNQHKSRDIDLSTGFSAGLLSNSNYANLLFEAGAQVFTDKTVRNKVSLGVQVPISKNIGFRFTIDHNSPDKNNYESYNEAALALRWHFR